MPTYEYGCTACGHEWEQVQRITEPPVEVCPKCAKFFAHRLISAGTNFILKGSGWYSDLYSSPKAKDNKPAASGESKSDTGAQTETKSESKSEAKADTTKPAPAGPTPPASTPPT